MVANFTFTWYLLAYTQQCKVRIKGKVEESRERSNTLLHTLMYYLLKREPSGRLRLFEFKKVKLANVVEGDQKASF